MAPELLFILGGVCGVVVSMALSGKFKTRRVRVCLLVAAVCGWGWFFMELLKSL